MTRKAGELRETLMAAIADVKAGTMTPATAISIAKLAAQVTNSLQVEINALKELHALGVVIDKVPGNMEIGHHVIEGEVTQPSVSAPPAVHRLNTNEDDHFDAGGRTRVALPAARVVTGSRYK